MVRMKKLLVLLTVAVGLFGFSTGAFAQGLLDVCSSCPKGDTVGTIGCDVPGQEGGSCTYFDYESGYGYQSGIKKYRELQSDLQCL